MDNTFWNDKYTQQPELYGTAPNEYFRDKIRDLSPGRLPAFDMSEVARKSALDKAKRSGLTLTYLLCKAEDFAFEQVYDAAALIYFHLPIAIRSTIHKRVADSVKPGGYLILESFHPKQLGYISGGPKQEEMFHTAEMLEKDFSGWEILEKLEGEVLLNEGIGHAGKAYVTRLFARRNPGKA